MKLDILTKQRIDKYFSEVTPDELLYVLLKINIIKMEKTKEIHNALRRRKFINIEIIDTKESIDRLTKIVNDFENEKKLLNFELHSWDIFSNKTNS